MLLFCQQLHDVCLQICFSGFKYYYNPKNFIPRIQYHNFSINLLGGGGLEGVFLIYTKSLYVRLILLKYATSGTAIISEIS
jgi:hypothetical protein